MKQSEFVAEIQLRYVPTNIKKRDYGKIHCSVDAYEFIYNLYDPDIIGLKEAFVVVFLNKGSRIIGFNLHSSGGIDGTIVDNRLIVATALKCAATGILTKSISNE